MDLISSESPKNTATDDKVFKVAIVAPTCFYYQSPIFRELAAHPRVDLTVYFCSDEAVSGNDVRMKFGTGHDWGNSDRTLEGYKYKFLRNYSPRPSYLRWPFGLMNFGVCWEIKKTRPDAVVLMSWVNVTDLVTISACLVFGTKLLIMTDANVQAEAQKSKWLSLVKKIFLGSFIFHIAEGFLYTGTANKLLYQSYGVPEEKLVPFAFSWESKDFLRAAETLLRQRNRIRAELGISQDEFVTLYCGRFSSEKAPLHLLMAYNQVEMREKALVFVGDGALNQELKNYVSDHDVKSVHFVGFQKRNEIAKFYAAADVLVLPSLQEATGAVITEAMSFGLPIIASDQVGFGMDLVEHDGNGYIFPAGDTAALAGYIAQIIQASEDQRTRMGNRSRELVEQWSELNLADSLLQHLDFLFPAKAAG